MWQSLYDFYMPRVPIYVRYSGASFQESCLQFFCLQFGESNYEFGRKKSWMLISGGQNWATSDFLFFVFANCEFNYAIEDESGGQLFGVLIMKKDLISHAKREEERCPC